MLSILKRRFLGINVFLVSCQVQGENASAEIIEGIKILNNFKFKEKLDAIILARGGGAIEDLFAFNDEKLARTIYKSNIPVVSAVGHETDYTIADYTSDLRAPTPSAAIEMIIPVKEDLIIQKTLYAFFWKNRQSNFRIGRARNSLEFVRR